MKLNNKWQCAKCKITKIVKVRIVKNRTTKQKTIHPKDVLKITHCHHVMRNLTDKQYDSEKALNDAGLRDDNKYRLDENYNPDKED